MRAPRLADDAKAIALVANDRRIAENTARIPHPYGIDDARAFVAGVHAGDGKAAFVGKASFVITLGGGVIGGCGIDPRDGDAEIGYWLGSAFWGQGFATEAVRALIDHAFGELGHDVLVAGARVSNPASRRVLEKCGFQWTGVRLTRIRAITRRRRSIAFGSIAGCGRR